MSTSIVTQILQALGPNCRDSVRRALILEQPSLNGIDFVEFEIAGPSFILHVHFLHVLPAGAFGLIADPSPIHVHGGTRIVGVGVKSAVMGGAPNILDVEVDEQGDFSPYLLSIGWARDGAGVWRFIFGGIDRLFSVAPVNFRPGCPVDFDCKPADSCPPEVLREPALDYLARDYASFRQMLLDLVAQRNPTWTERSPADVGIALLELLAHEGDHLSYFQDAVANEAFLDTARQRVSAKRHAKIVDYQMHDGRNAWTDVHVRVKSAGTIPAGTQLVTRISSTMRFDRDGTTPVPQPKVPPGPELNVIDDTDYITDPALAQVRVFETTTVLNVDPLLNELRLHTWGNKQCCLPRGTTMAQLYAIDAIALKAVRPSIKAGDRVLLEEVLGPKTGAAADADPAHRCVVRVLSVNPDPSTSTTGPASDQMHDPLFLDSLNPTTLEPIPISVPVPIAQTLPLVEVTWQPEDALGFPLCLASQLQDGAEVHNVSLARGNMTLADHGRTLRTVDSYTFAPPLTAEPTFRLRLKEGPLTMRCAGNSLACDVRAAQPAVRVKATYFGGGTEIFTPVADLLSSTRLMANLVADVDNVGRAVLRFGDGEYGKRLIDVTKLEATYRIGNGLAGNIGAEGLAHIVRPQAAPLPLNWPTTGGKSAIELVRNPLPAQGGQDPELIEQVRNYAPAAFRATQLRAVTELDYKNAALSIDGVSGAVASFRWTGSWYTVFVGIDPADPEMVITDARGHTRLDDKFKQKVLDALTCYRLAGYDLEIRSAHYVPLDVSIQVCAKPGYFRGDVAHAVSLALSAGTRADGKRGLFDPANFTFGQPVYLSRIYAAVENVEGVESASITAFHPYGRDPANELENGTLTISAGGGS